MINSQTIAKWGYNNEELDDLDAWTTEWQLVKLAGGVWGGRSRGGRGVRNTTGMTTNISVDGVSLQFAGKSLLSNASLRFQRGHIYGLLGPNGIGKSTLLRRFAKQSIPGVPIHLRIVYLQQEIPCNADHEITVFKYLSDMMNPERSGGGDRTASLNMLREEENRLESLLLKLSSNGSEDSAALEAITNQLCDIGEQLDALESQNDTGEGTAETLDAPSVGANDAERMADTILSWHQQVKNILTGLGLLISKGGKTKASKFLTQKMCELSGGWRLRIALALALVACAQESGSGDVLLLDEPTNHLDLPTIVWLQRYLVSKCEHLTCIVVSHDRSFLDAVCTDVAEIKDEKIVYFPGGYSLWERNQSEMQTYRNNMLEAQSRKEEHLKRSIENLKSRGKEDVSAASAAKSKEKKLERAGMHRGLDGKKFKLFSLKTLEESSLRLPQYVQALRKNKTLHFKFPSPLGLGLSSPSAVLLSLDRCLISWGNGNAGAGMVGDVAPILKSVSLSITMSSRIAIVGPNGQGKSTLLNALLSEFSYVPSAKKSSAAIASEKSDVVPTIPSPPTANAPSREKPPVVAPALLSIPRGGGTVISLPSSEKKVLVKKPSADNASSADTQIRPGGVVIRGNCFSYHNLRVAIVSQHHIDAMSDHLLTSPLIYCTGILQDMIEQSIRSGFSGYEALRMSELEIRAHLGNFGLSGDIVLKPIGSLSGGQKTRLAFATVCIYKPHVLLLDEPTNNLAVEAIDALALACQDFGGAIVLVSHNFDFLCQVCKELVIVDQGSVAVKKSVADVLAKPTQGLSGTGTGTASGSSSGPARGAAAAALPPPPATIGEESFGDILDAYISTQVGDI